MANVTPDNAAVWFEIPVTDMKRAKAFYDAVLQDRASRTTTPGRTRWRCSRSRT